MTEPQASTHVENPAFYWILDSWAPPGSLVLITDQMTWFYTLNLVAEFLPKIMSNLPLGLPVSPRLPGMADLTLDSSSVMKEPWPLCKLFGPACLRNLCSPGLLGPQWPPGWIPPLDCPCSCLQSLFSGCFWNTALWVFMNANYGIFLKWHSDSFVETLPTEWLCGTSYK